jgi:hypothetical protein
MIKAIKIGARFTPGRYDFDDMRLNPIHFRVIAPLFERFSGFRLHGECYEFQASSKSLVYLFHRLWIEFPPGTSPHRDVVADLHGYLYGARDALEAVRA